MNPRLARRQFLNQALTAAAGMLALPALCRATLPALNRPGTPRLLLSLAAYSFREYMRDNTHGQPAGADAVKMIDMLGFIDFAADHGCLGAELTSYYFPPNVTRDYLIRVKRHAFLRGIAVSGSAAGNNFALPDGPGLDSEIAGVKTWIDHCVTLGAPHLRVFAGEP